MSTRTRAVTVAAAFAFLSMPAVATAAGQPVAVLNSPASETRLSVNGSYLAWSQAPKSNPDAPDGFVQKKGESRTRVNAKGTDAYMGSVESGRVLYQQVSGSRSDLFFFDISTKRRRPLPPRVNTSAWEYWPTMSGDWVLYGRFHPSQHVRAIHLFNLKSGRDLVLGKTHGDDRYTGAGQVNGRFATWMECDPVCDVFLRNIPAGTTKRIPNPGGKYQYNPGVSESGIVYFVRSGDACGKNVSLMRKPRVGKATEVVQLPDGVDVVSVSAVARGKHTDVFYSRGRCKDELYDVYKITD